MANGEVDIKLRPIKFAFIIAPDDQKGLLEAIEINTLLWGGVHNPIIPYFKRLPKTWAKSSGRFYQSKDIFTGYLDAYDPDYVVPVGKCSNLTLEVGHRKTISPPEILSMFESYGVPKFGIGIFEILQYFVGKELKFIRKQPLEIYSINFNGRYQLFLSSVFGSLPRKFKEGFLENFKDALELKESNRSISDYSELLTPGKLFLRRMTSLYVRRHRTRTTWEQDKCVFFLDAGNILDVVDYWNLRAIGWTVVPIAKQSCQMDGVKQMAVDFIEENFYPLRGNPKIFHNSTILKGRSISEEEVKDFVKTLGIKRSEEQGNPKYLLQSWYPRIWDEWASEHDDVVCCRLEADNTKIDVSDYEKGITVRTLAPKFINRFSVGGPRFVNEIELRLFGGKELYAEVIPEGEKDLLRAFGGFGFNEWRFSKRGICYLSRYTNWPIRLPPPNAEDIFLEWLKTHNWVVALSEKGKIAKQMIKHLGGKWGISTLASEGIIRLLESASDGKPISRESFFGETSKIANQEKFLGGQKAIVQRLIDTQMFRLGMTIQCPICSQHSWYSVIDAAYELQCSNCREQFQIPSHSPDEIKWEYQAFEPFNKPKRADGTYSVLLTLNFFTRLLDGATTPIMSFYAKKEGKQVEIDLGLFYQESKFGYSKTHSIFAECTTYMDFDKKDSQRMRFFGNKFPGAILVFSTLKKSLTKKEKELLKPIVNRGRKSWKAEHPFNPVLILTGNELFSHFGPPTCWKDAEGNAKRFAEDYHVSNDLIHLCDVTQQIYLDMKPWHEWFREKWEKRRRKKVDPSEQMDVSDTAV